MDEDAGKHPTSGHKKDVSDENTVNVENVENDDVDVEMKDTEDKKDTASVPPEVPNKALDTADLDSNRDIAHEDWLIELLRTTYIYIYVYIWYKQQFRVLDYVVLIFY